MAGKRTVRRKRGIPRRRPGTKAAGKTAAAKKEEQAARRRRVQADAVMLFAAGILAACLVLIEGDSLWRWFHRVLLGLFGNCAVLWPILLLYISVMTALEKPAGRTGGKLGLMILIIQLFCSAVYVFSTPEAVPLGSYGKTLLSLYQAGIEHAGAGMSGGLLGIPAAAGLGIIGARIVLLLALFVSLMILTGTGLIELFRTIAKPADAVASNISSAMEQRETGRSRENADIDIPLGPEEMPDHPVRSSDTEKGKPKKSRQLEHLEKVFAFGNDSKKKSAADTGIPQAASSGRPSPAGKGNSSSPQEILRQPTEEDGDDGYHFPPISMLETSVSTGREEEKHEIEGNGKKLIETLQNFGVRATLTGYSRGPAVTRYELQPAAGVKISKITSLSDDLSMNLATAGIRIEAPIPGKAAVGIEVPNKNKSIVRMRELVESNSFRMSKSHLTVALGRDIAGEVAVADLAKMPHLLIAGATGSGKSVCINSMIISMLYKSTPKQVRFLMIDPKVVELGIYNGIPHLLVPVVTNPRKAAGALSWAVTEMLKRYRIFAENSVRDLQAYNHLAKEKGYQDENGQPMENMPQIVIIIDELADLMMAAPNEVEDSICRLAQMARAAGMHLVIATQRPSVNVITGIIKANIPSRIAFSVSSQVDSRTILDMGGAEKLLGHGDMLFSPVGSQKPKRIQGCFTSESEIESVTGFIKKSQQADYDRNIVDEIEKNAVEDKKSSGRDSREGDETDPMLPEAVKCVVDCGQASTSLLQRRLRLGYARAGRIVDQMEKKGIVGPQDGSKPRKVLITYQQWLEMNMRQSDNQEQEKDPGDS